MIVNMFICFLSTFHQPFNQSVICWIAHVVLLLLQVDSAFHFMWLSQLRHRWDEAARHCYANICDAQFKYSYEYLGNTARLVITPLTDRCYITLTQSLHLTMSGAPAGPAGTGKTETTKDLGRALGIMVYVFNCSEQMDYKVLQLLCSGYASCIYEANVYCLWSGDGQWLPRESQRDGPKYVHTLVYCVLE